MFVAVNQGIIPLREFILIYTIRSSLGFMERISCFNDEVHGIHIACKLQHLNHIHSSLENIQLKELCSISRTEQKVSTITFLVTQRLQTKACTELAKPVCRLSQ